MLIKGYAKYCVPAVAAFIGTCVLIAQQPRRVDDALLKTGSRDGSEWVAYGTNWAEQRYSPLNQINADNIGRLGLEWAYEIPFAPMADVSPPRTTAFSGGLQWSLEP